MALQVPLHIFTAALLCLSAWLAGRRPGSLWAGELLLVSGVAYGAVAARGVGRVWPAAARGSRRGLDELLGGRTGYALLYVGGVLFAGAEAYAAGLAFDEGAPVLALALLFPPVAMAGYALRRAAAPESFAGPATDPSGRSRDVEDAEAKDRGESQPDGS